MADNAPQTVSYDDLSNKPKGSGFVNLSSFLDANKDNQLGGALSGGINQGVQNVNNNLQNQQNTFQTGLQADQARTGQEVQGVQNSFQNIDQGQALGANDASNYSALQSDAYKGPQGLNDVPGLQNQAYNAQELGNEVNTRAGRVDLLNQFAGQGVDNYSLNNRNLDELFLGNNNQQDLLDARRNALGVFGNVNSGINVAQGQANQAQSDLTNQQQQATQGVTDRVGNVTSAVQNQYNTDLANQQNQYNSLAQDISNKQLSAADQALLGIGQGTTVYNSNLLGYATPEQLSQSGALNDAQKATLNSLGSLTGQDAGTLSGLDVNATSYDPNNLLSYNKSGLQSSIAQQAAAYNNYLNNATVGANLYMVDPNSITGNLDALTQGNPNVGGPGNGGVAGGNLQAMLADYNNPNSVDHYFLGQSAPTGYEAKEYNNLNALLNAIKGRYGANNAV